MDDHDDSDSDEVNANTLFYDVNSFDMCRKFYRSRPRRIRIQIRL